MASLQSTVQSQAAGPLTVRSITVRTALVVLFAASVVVAAAPRAPAAAPGKQASRAQPSASASAAAAPPSASQAERAVAHNVTSLERRDGARLLWELPLRRAASAAHEADLTALPAPHHATWVVSAQGHVLYVDGAGSPRFQLGLRERMLHGELPEVAADGALVVHTRRGVIRVRPDGQLEDRTARVPGVVDAQLGPSVPVHTLLPPGFSPLGDLKLGPAVRGLPHVSGWALKWVPAKPASGAAANGSELELYAIDGAQLVRHTALEEALRPLLRERLVPPSSEAEARFRATRHLVVAGSSDGHELACLGGTCVGIGFSAPWQLAPGPRASWKPLSWQWSKEPGASLQSLAILRGTVWALTAYDGRLGTTLLRAGTPLWKAPLNTAVLDWLALDEGPLMVGFTAGDPGSPCILWRVSGATVSEEICPFALFGAVAPIQLAGTAQELWLGLDLPRGDESPVFVRANGFWTGVRGVSGTPVSADGPGGAWVRARDNLRRVQVALPALPPAAPPPLPPAVAPSRALPLTGPAAPYTLTRVELPVARSTPLRHAREVARATDGTLWFHDGSRVVEHANGQARVLAPLSVLPTCFHCLLPRAAGVGQLLVGTPGPNLELRDVDGGRLGAPRAVGGYAGLSPGHGERQTVLAPLGDWPATALVSEGATLRPFTVPDASYAAVSSFVVGDGAQLWLGGGVGPLASDEVRHWPSGEGVLAFVDGARVEHLRAPDGPLLATVGVAAGEGWGVGVRGGVVHRRSDGVVERFHLTHEPTLMAAAATARDDVWFAGTAGTLVHWDGSRFERVDTSAVGEGAALLSMVPPTATQPGYVVGPRGVFRLERRR